MKNKIILLVEDRDDDIELILEALKENRIINEVVVVRDGEKALDYLFMRGEYAGNNLDRMPTVILLDIKLPKINGLEVLKQVRANSLTKLFPVVILTSSKEEQDLISGYSLGCNSYVRKPVEFQQFSEAVRNLGLYWLLINEPPSKEKN
ncbi:MAG: response regulator [Candidatus Omnitrophota bacterium]|nr:MAG: response regulator [Candidatus Omnitrophota bacterium]